jgi:hypothetical protein
MVLVRPTRRCCRRLGTSCCRIGARQGLAPISHAVTSAHKCKAPYNKKGPHQQGFLQWTGLGVVQTTRWSRLGVRSASSEGDLERRSGPSGESCTISACRAERRRSGSRDPARVGRARAESRPGVAWPGSPPECPERCRRSALIAGLPHGTYTTSMGTSLTRNSCWILPVALSLATRHSTFAAPAARTCRRAWSSSLLPTK